MPSRASQTLKLDGLRLDDLRNEGLPKYRQIYIALSNAIRGDSESLGKMLPFESRIAECFDVSKITVRQALGLLETDGLIEKNHGKPARVVNSHSEKRNSFRRLSTLCDLVNDEFHRKTIVVDFESHQSSFAASVFNIPDSELMFRLRLKHFTEMKQFGYSEVFFHPDIGEKLTLMDFVAASNNPPLHVFRTVEAKLGFQVQRAQVTIGSEPENPADPKTDPISASLLRMQLVFSRDTGPIQVSNNWFDARLYEVNYELAI